MSVSGPVAATMANALQSAVGGSQVGRAGASTEQDSSVRDAFQKFVAGTFYKQMLKSMRKMHDKPAYFHGGQAEEMFQGQMDQQVAEDLSIKHGAALTEPLFQAFTAKLRAQQIEGAAQPRPNGLAELSRLTAHDNSESAALDARLATSAQVQP